MKKFHERHDYEAVARKQQFNNTERNYIHLLFGKKWGNEIYSYGPCYLLTIYRPLSRYWNKI